MAYNPFDFFRRNQKLFFAGLTILVMFMFVLSFGRGDFFSWFPDQLRKWQTTGDVMAKIDGATIKESQLRDVGQERTLANNYMMQAAGKAMDASYRAAEKEAEGANPDLKGQLQSYLRTFTAALQLRRTETEDLSFARMRLEQMAGELAKLEKDIPKSDDAKRVKAVRVFAESVRAEVARRAAGDKSESGVYFANQPNRTDRERLEFLLWKKKADQLGIRLTHEHVIALVDAEFPTSLVTQEELKAMAVDAAAKAGKRTNELYDALADEFRVRAAQTAVLGLSDVRYTGLNTAGTTEQRYEHFIQETTATKYTFFTIPVAAYLSQVQGEPTEAELTKIFNETNGTDPDPASPRFGIREPRKVGVQWVEISGSEDYYKTLAVQRSEAFKKLQASTAAQSVLGPTVAPPEVAVLYGKYLEGQAAVVQYRQGRFANPGRPILSNYGRGIVGGGLMMDDSGYMFGQSALPDPSDRLLDAEFVQPELMASLVGLSATGFATNAPLLAPTVAVTETAFRQTREKRVVAGIQAFHFPTLPGLAALAEATGGATSAFAGSPAPLPQAAVQPMLDKQTTEQLRVVVATEDVQEFQKELTRITGQKYDAPKGADKATLEKGEREHKAKVTKEAAEYVAKWIETRKLKTGGTTEPRTVHTLADDPGLAPLVVQDKTLHKAFTNELKDSRARTSFGQAFVNETDLAQSFDGGLQSRLRPVSGLYQPRTYDPVGGRQLFRQMATGQDYAPFAFMGNLSVSQNAPLTAFWRTAEVEAVRPLSLTSDKAAREKCKAIWKMTKARELARKAADGAAAAIAKAVADKTDLNQFTADLLFQLKKPFGNDPVAEKFKLVRQDPTFSAAKLLLDSQFGGPPVVKPFNPQHSEIVYETEEMRKELLANKDKPVGTTFMFTDQPQSTLYLTVVADHTQQENHVFRNNVLYPEPLSTQLKELMASRFAGYLRDADRKTAISLLKAEFKYTDENPKLDEKRD